MKLWWLSFASSSRPEGDQFLGVAIVEAPGFGAAHLTACVLGCNPGGEVIGHEIPERFHPAILPEDRGRLLDRAALAALERRLERCVS